MHVQRCHGHADARLAVRVTKELEEFAGYLAELHSGLHRFNFCYSATCRRDRSFGLSFDPKPLIAASISSML